MSNKRTQTNVQRTVVILVCVMVVFVGAAVSRILRSPAPEAPSDTTVNSTALQQQGAFIRPVPKVLEEFQLTGADGLPFTIDNFKDRWSLVFLGFTQCPDICPTTMALFKQLQARWQGSELGHIQYVLLSADPERDTPWKLREYLNFFSSDFVGVTGSVSGVAAFAKQLNGVFARVPQDNGDYLIDHSANIMIINPSGQFHGFVRPPHTVAQFEVVMRAVTN